MKNFEEEIKERINNKEELFYNTNGSTKAFKLHVKHISSAAYFNLGFVVSNYFHPYDSILVVDFENEKIEKVTEKIKINQLTHHY